MESTFTFQKENTASLESLEWDNVWWEQTEDNSTDRILYIGDSISCGIRRLATDNSRGKFLFDGFGTSKAVDNPYFAESVRLFAAQQKKRKAIVFNNGLHGWHLSDDKEYAEHYESFARFLLKEFKDTQIILLTSTYVRDEETLTRVRVRNEQVRKIADKLNLPIIDLYSCAEENKNLIAADGVHFLDEGYNKLADFLVQKLGNNLWGNL